MIRLLTTCFILISGQLLVGQHTSSVKSCESDFKKVYSFSLGDVFQYRKSVSDGSAGYEQSQIWITKFQIDQKVQQGDTILYEISGIGRSYWEEPGSPQYGITSWILDQELVFIDSSSHILNFCSDTVLVNPENGYYAIVSDSINGDTIGKHVGGDNRLFSVNSEGRFEPVYFDRYEELYGNGLGMLSKTLSQFEWISYECLEGFIKNNDTIGKINTDEELLATFIEKEYNTNVGLYPNPATDRVYFHSRNNQGIKYLIVYTIDGRNVIRCLLGTDPVDISRLSKGAYFYQIIDEDRETILHGKLIKE